MDTYRCCTLPHCYILNSEFSCWMFKFGKLKSRYQLQVSRVPISLSLKNCYFPHVELPVCLVCAYSRLASVNRVIFLGGSSEQWRTSGRAVGQQDAHVARSRARRGQLRRRGAPAASRRKPVGPERPGRALGEAQRPVDGICAQNVRA